MLADGRVMVSVFPTDEKKEKNPGVQRVILENPQIIRMIMKKKPIPAKMFEIRLGFGVSIGLRPGACMNVK